jgi:flagellar biosynthetic protein FlhB
MNLQRFAGERTEAATPKRRDEARRRGQVARSIEVNTAVVLLGAWGLINLFGSSMAGRLLRFGQTLWEHGATQDWSPEGVRQLLVQALWVSVLVGGPIALGGMLLGVAANLLQVGFLFTLEPLTPNFGRLNPLEGLKRIFSRRSLVELVKSLLKMGLVGFVAYQTVRDDLGRFPTLMQVGLPGAVRFMMDLISRLLLTVGILMLILAIADYLYQRFEYEVSLRMTKQELKEEFKNIEGNPEIRAKIRQKQRELARRRMMADVPKADVVVTNPTHFAVALAYAQGEMGAPKVLAKGQGLVALRIREIAKEHGVPVVENKPLARELHKLVEIGQEIPFHLYQAVAELLAFVYQLKKKGY